jgi:hypothetical protein
MNRHYIPNDKCEQLHFFCFFLSFFLKLFAIFWRFYLDTAGLKIGYRTSPSPSPKSEVRSPSPTWKTLVRKPNNCSQFDQDEAVTAATCAAQVAVTWPYRPRIPNNCYQLRIPGRCEGRFPGGSG